MNVQMLAAAQYAVNSSGFNPQSYRYAGAVNIIAHIAAGGQEYGFMLGQGGAVTPNQLDGRNIHRVSWKRKDAYQPAARELVVSINGTSRPNITKLALVKDGQIIVEVATTVNEGTFNEQQYSMIFLTGEADLPISGAVDLYIN